MIVIYMYEENLKTMSVFKVLFLKKKKIILNFLKPAIGTNILVFSFNNPFSFNNSRCFLSNSKSSPVFQRFASPDKIMFWREIGI